MRKRLSTTVVFFFDSSDIEDIQVRSETKLVSSQIGYTWL